MLLFANDDNGISWGKRHLSEEKLNDPDQSKRVVCTRLYYGKRVVFIVVVVVYFDENSDHFDRF